MEKFDCLFFGGATHDIIFVVERVPLSDERIEALRVIQCGGGQAATAAVALQSLGKRTGFISAVGDDESGRMIYNELKARNIDVSSLFMLKGKSTPLSAIHVEKSTGKRAITVCYGNSLRCLNTSDIDLNKLNQTKAVHLDADHFDLTLYIAKYCHENTKASISLDGGNIPGDELERLLPYVDIFIPDNKSTLKVLGNVSFEDACRYWYKCGPKVVCITLGDKGLIAYDGNEFYRIGSYPVDIVDTTGAGDNFHGAFLYGYLERWPILKTLKFASAFAGLTCRGFGGREKIPSQDEVEKLMNSYEV